MLNRIPTTNVIPTAIHSPDEERGFDLREGIGFLWRQWIFIASILGAVLFVAGVYVFSETPRYTATAQVLLEMQQELPGKSDAILSQANLDFEMVESQLAIIKSTVFLKRVVEKLRLASEPEFGSPTTQAAQAPSLLSRIRSAFLGRPAASASTLRTMAMPFRRMSCPQFKR